MCSNYCLIDGDFQPHEESDDEETIEVEEQQEGNDSETRQREIELLKHEGELPLEELLQSLPPQILENSLSVSPCASISNSDEEGKGDSEEEEEQVEKETSKNLKVCCCFMGKSWIWGPAGVHLDAAAKEIYLLGFGSRSVSNASFSSVVICS